MSHLNRKLNAAVMAATPRVLTPSIVPPPVSRAVMPTSVAGHSSAPVKLIDLQTVAERFGECSTKTIRRKLDEPDFPQPVRGIVRGKLMFVEAEIDAYIASKIAERDASFKRSA